MKHAYLWRNSHSIYISSIYIYNSVTNASTIIIQIPPMDRAPQWYEAAQPTHSELGESADAGSVNNGDAFLGWSVRVH